MDNQAAIANFFQSGPKSRDQVRRQVANESHGIVNDYFLLARETKPARGRIEGGKHPLFGADFTVRERIEQRRFPCIGITDDRDNWQALPRARLASFLPAMPLRLDLFLQSIDSITHATSISLQLCF